MSKTSTRNEIVQLLAANRETLEAHLLDFWRAA
jgi:hypothetical protein